MIVYGFAKAYRYLGDGTLQIQVRIPNIHGSYRQQSGRATYTRDEDLPWLASVLLPHLPNEGEVVMLESATGSNSSEFVCIGLTGGSYYNGTEL